MIEYLNKLGLKQKTWNNLW